MNWNKAGSSNACTPAIPSADGGAEVYVPDYRLAPEHPYPAAFGDALAAWRLVKSLRPNAPIFVAGDSAGGGLSLSLLARLRDIGMAMPSGALLARIAAPRTFHRFSPSFPDCRRSCCSTKAGSRGAR